MTDLGIARDTEGHLQGCFERAITLGIDVLITSGECALQECFESAITIVAPYFRLEFLEAWMDTDHLVLAMWLGSSPPRG